MRLPDCPIRLTSVSTRGIISIIFEILEYMRPHVNEEDRQFMALANKHRLAIFEYLRKHELTCDESGQGCKVGDVAQQFDLALSTVSHHLKVLYEAGLIRCDQKGQHVFCSINWEAIDELRRFLSE